MTTLLLDNYDSFTFNIVQLLAAVGEPTLVLKNDDLAGWQALDWDEVDRIVVSPGPGSPSVATDLGLSRDAILMRAKPLLGVCLGHQALCLLSGGTVGRAPRPMHGRASRIHHRQEGMFAGIPDGFLATRYHSLEVTAVPDRVEATAWSDDGVLMAVSHRDWPAWGVQFHPESVGSEHGARLMANFLELTAPSTRPKPAAARRPPASPPTGQPRLVESQWIELDSVPDPGAALKALFPDDDVAFWIDTLSTDGRSAPLSYIGTGRGAGSERVSCRLSDGFVKVVPTTGVERAVPGRIEEFIGSRLQSFRATGGGPVPFNLGYVGWLGYELRDLGGAPHQRSAPHPDALLVLADRMLIIDHQDSRAWLAAFDFPSEVARDEDAAAVGGAAAWLEEAARDLVAIGPAPAPVPPDEVVMPRIEFRHDVPAYLDRIAACQDLINAGESYELCLTNQVRVQTSVDPFELFWVLRSLNPAPFATYIRTPGLAIAGASPERFLTVDRGIMVSKPMKGTRRRGEDPVEDAWLRAELASSEKERAENLMITDLVRNDLGAVARPGTVVVDRLFDVETYPHVHQLVSTVSAVSDDGISLMDVLAATFPGGSMTGAPKRRSTELLDRLEGGPRGVYSGVSGFISFDDRLDLSMVIRTAVVTTDEVTVGVGGAITILSDPDDEVAEMQLKGEPLLQAVALVSGRPSASST